MTMKKILNIALIAFVALSTVACYNDFGTPEPGHVYTDADFEEEIVSIRHLKDYYSKHVGNSTSDQITEDWVIRGKVISSDESGNIYKSLYIQDDDATDGRAAIELRLFASNYTKYPVGYMVYVKLKDLSVGDYSGMISIGARATDSTSDYVHTTIENRITLDEHIFLGESGSVTEDDIYVVDSSNYESLFTSDTDNYLACLVRFEGLESAFTESGAAEWTTYTYPSYFAENTTEGKFDWSSGLGELDEYWINPPLAYKGTNPTTGGSESLYFYGSSWFTYDRDSESHTAQYILRLSGYARFKDRFIPADGNKINLTAIFTRYLNSSGYYTTYQLVPSFSEDIVEL